MRYRRISLATAAALGIGTVAALSAQSASASDGARPVLHVHEATAGKQFLDLGPTGPSFGDELVGTNTLTRTDGKAAGTDTFVCTSVAADGTALQCAVVFSLPGGRVTAQGYAKIVGTKPLFDEQFAVTGGTMGNDMARGYVRVVQNSQQDADLYFHLTS